MIRLNINFLGEENRKHSFAGQKGKHSLADSAKPMGKKTISHTGVKSAGRGVWESNPSGTAPSDPPAVLKTVRPTGAPTPPYMWHVAVFCHSRAFLSSLALSITQVHARALHLPLSGPLPSSPPRVTQAGSGHRQPRYSAFLQRALPVPPQQHLRSPGTLLDPCVAH